MKNAIFTFLIIMLFISTTGNYGFWYRIDKKNTEIKQLRAQIKELEKVDKSTIIITDTVLVVWSNFDIKNNAYQHPNTRSLHDGKNKHDFTINDSTRVEIIIMKN